MRNVNQYPAFSVSSFLLTFAADGVLAILGIVFRLLAYGRAAVDDDGGLLDVLNGDHVGRDNAQLHHNAHLGGDGAVFPISAFSSSSSSPSPRMECLAYCVLELAR